MTMKVVCVTGASGYIASWLVKLLLRRGYIALEGAAERLHLFKADLLEEGSFDSAVDGCEGVFHTASPVLLSPKDPQVLPNPHHCNKPPQKGFDFVFHCVQTELIDPAVKGTLNVLRSCKRFPSVKRVVITSSITSVAYNGKPWTADVVIDETWFSDPALCEQMKQWYVLSKTLAEEAAWNFAKENGMDLVTLHPGFVIGPSLSPHLCATAEIILNLISGAETFPNTNYRFVDIRDVAETHIHAFEISSASGRYCVVGQVTHCYEALKILRELYPALQLPEKCADDKPLEPTYQISKQRVENLGINFTPLEVSLKDTVESLRENKFFRM